MRLLLVELGRFRSRRAVVVVLLVTMVLAGLMVASTVYETRAVDATERAAAETMLERERVALAEQYADCLADPDEFFGGPSTAADCEASQPQLEWFLSRPQLDLGAEVQDSGMVLLFLLAAAAILVGATFAGADWSTGSMSNQLLFRPRRLRVWAAKATAVVLGATAAAAVVLVLFWGVLAGVASARGLETPGPVWDRVLGTGGRGLALVAGVALGAFALTMLLRATVGTLGLLFGYAVVGEGLAATLPFDRMSQWSLSRNVLAWLQDGVEVFDESSCGNTAERCNPFYELTLAHAATYLGVLLLVAVAVSLVGFQRRDVP